MAEECSAPKILEDIIHQAEYSRASDVHLQMASSKASISFRIDGVLKPVMELPEGLSERVLGRIKYLARLKTYQDSLPQEGRIDKADIRSADDIRVSTYPTITGEKIVLRLFYRHQLLELDDLNFPDDLKSEVKAFLSKTSGMLLLTGPAGSGKTTTIYACLKYIAGLGGRNIITIEDPVEQIIPQIMQTEINQERGLDFSKAARHLLRQDPEVIVIGEIRDDETANISIRAAFTGHLVISTLHAGSCKAVVERILMMCEDRYSAISALEMVINQRLIRKLCPKCQGKKCQECLNIGYSGRIPIAELVKLDEASKKQIREKGVDTIIPTITLVRHAHTLVEKNITDKTECIRIFGHGF